MEVFTSYYARVRSIKKENSVFISISRYNPSWFTEELQQLLSLAPSSNLLTRYKNGLVTKEQYTEEYNSQLNSIDLSTLAKKLSVDKDVSVFFLCYEKPTDFCHRHLFAKHMEENYGIIINEYGN